VSLIGAGPTQFIQYTSQAVTRAVTKTGPDVRFTECRLNEVALDHFYIVPPPFLQYKLEECHVDRRLNLTVILLDFQ